MSGTTVAGGTKKGRSESETRPIPKPVRPKTKLATANIPAPATQVKFTQGPLRRLSYLHCPIPPVRAREASYPRRGEIVLMLMEQRQIPEGVACPRYTKIGRGSVTIWRSMITYDSL